eukprot:TRINITY_DN38440_c0_g1_i1.p1 TRINITY_DN38440_c0_g1~~TRINITY_DN38440_c0_g1_i1.p1  ORF type:complete len:202 (-),score=25.70 TRINITY_DN38440_c0_g1_i1:232-768(-)
MAVESLSQAHSVGASSACHQKLEHNAKRLRRSQKEGGKLDCILTLRGVMHPTTSCSNVYRTVEDFLHAYQHETEKLGEKLLHCKQGQSWSSLPQPRSITEEVNHLTQVQSKVNSDIYTEFEEDQVELDSQGAFLESQSCDSSLAFDTLKMNSREFQQSLVCASICTFSLGLILGMRGW